MSPPFRVKDKGELLAGSDECHFVVSECGIIGICDLDTNAPSCSEFFLEFANGLVSANSEFTTLCTFGAEGSEGCIVIGKGALAGHALVNAQAAAEILLEVGLEGLYLHTAVDFEFCHNVLCFKWLIEYNG